MPIWLRAAPFTRKAESKMDRFLKNASDFVWVILGILMLMFFLASIVGRQARADDQGAVLTIEGEFQ